MGNCCVKRKKTLDTSSQFLNEIVKKLKLSYITFENAYLLLTGEVLPEKLDNLKSISFLEFDEICKAKFYEEDITKNDFANIHNFLFERLMSRCEWLNLKRVYIWKVLLFLLPFLNNNNDEKLGYFFYITNHLLANCETSSFILNLRYCFRLYLENNLIFITKLVLEYIKENNDNFNVHPQSKQEIICFLGKCVKTNMRKFMIEKICGAFNLEENKDYKNIDLEQIKNRLNDKKFIFDFFDLRDYYSHLNQNFGDIRVTYYNINLELLDDDDFSKIDV